MEGQLSATTGTKAPSPSMTEFSGQDMPDPVPQQALKPRTRTSSHKLSSAAIDISSTSRKGPYAEAGTSDANVERASISMPAPSNRPHMRSRPSSTFSYRRPSNNSEIWLEGRGSPYSESAIEDNFHDTPKLHAGIMADQQRHPVLPEASLRPRGSTDIDTKRMSTSSIYSLNSARAGGIQSPATSVNGSEVGTRPASGSVSNSKALGISHPEVATSAISVTTSSMSQYSNDGSTLTSAHQLTTRDVSNDGAKGRETARAEGSARTSIPRSRSRAQRRFSVGTATSSHSPSSERGLHNRSNNEGRWCRNLNISPVTDISTSETSITRYHWSLCS
jgi:inositol hexakisphosphate/diphosphoinositol-pentakisphosphate kinase